MNKVIIDAGLHPNLEGLNDPVELCDASGRTLGFVLPPELYERWLYDWSRAQFDDEAELQKAREETERLTTAQAMAFVEQLAREESQGS